MASIASDGQLVVTESFGTEDRVRLWDFETGRLIRLFPGNKAVILPDTKLIVASSLDGPTRILRTTNGENIAEVATTNVIGLAAASDNSSVAVVDHPEANGSDALKIYVWDVGLQKVSIAFDVELGPPAENPALENTFLQVAFALTRKSLVIGTSNWIETWSLSTGKRITHVKNQTRVEHLSFSADASMFAAASGRQIKIGFVQTGIEVSSIEQGPRDGCMGRGFSLAFSPTEKLLATKDFCVRMWDYETGKEVWSAPRTTSLAELMGAPVFWKNGNYVLAGNTLYEAHTGKVYRSIGEVPRTWSVAFSALSNRFAMFAKEPDTQISSRLWDVFSGRYERTSVLPSPGYEWPWGVSPDLKTLVTSTGGSQISIRRFPFEGSRQDLDWRANPMPKEVPRTIAIDPTILMRGLIITGVFAPIATGPPINSADFCALGKYVAIGGNDYSGRLVDLQTYQEIVRLSVPYPLAKVALSEDCNLFAVAAADVVKVLDIAQNQTREFKFHAEEHETVSALSFSTDNQFLIAGSNRGGANGSTYIWNRKTEKLLGHLTATGGVTALTFSRDCRYALAGYYSGDIAIWDLQLQNQLPSKRYPGEIVSAGFFADNHHFFVSGKDGAVEIWDKDEASYLATIEFSADGTWTVVAPDGRFDSNDLFSNRSLRWIISSRPLEPLPVEIFMRQYFEPHLLDKLLKHAQLSELPPISSLNLAQPSVRILSIRPSGGSRNSVNIRVAVKSESIEDDGHINESEGSRDSMGVRTNRNGRHPESGAYDVRLFRDNQMVAQWPEHDPELVEKTGPIVSDHDKDVWRQQHRVKLDAQGNATITFSGIRLPQRPDVDQVQFTAYAFNSDRVKSLTTAPFAFAVPHSSPVISRTAFLITMGVNANQSRNLDLDLAVSSAERARSLLHTKLQAEYQHIVEIPLYADRDADSEHTKLNNANRADLKVVFDLLAGRSVASSLRDKVDPNHQLRRATPDDGVVLFVASHGFVDPKGAFYLMPYDTGPNWGITEEILTGCLNRPNHSDSCNQAQDFLNHSVSTSDLTAWWNEVDAGQTIMILDSCHAGAVPGKEFRAAPFGDPGFGQLSYDKGMVILTASQPTQTEKGELVTGGEGRTLLVDAMDTAAKANPNAALTLWLHEAEQELPQIAKALYPQLTDENVQYPLLLDFSKKAVATIRASLVRKN